MKTTTFLAICAMLVTTLLVSCGSGGLSGLPKSKKEYAGTWFSDDMSLTISTNGKVNYKRVSGSSTTSVNAPIQKFQGNNFIVGAFGMNTTFLVSQPPHQEAGVWMMTVDGEELTRQ
jgi:hypothetical protein